MPDAASGRPEGDRRLGSVTSLSIPPTPADVTAAWLTDVLRRAGAIDAAGSVTSFVGEPVGAGIGVMGVLLRATLTYAGTAGTAAPRSVIVKLPSPYPENRAQGIAMGMYEAEVRFLNEMASRTPVRLPRIYFAEIVSGTADTRWNRWLTTQVALGYRDTFDSRVGNTITFAAPNLANSTSIDGAVARTSATVPTAIRPASGIG